MYNREKAINYAKIWAYKRNPTYLNFNSLGGDCTNFISQCLFAGTNIMNYTPIIGWFYISANNRTASWTGVAYLSSFLLNNKGAGPKGHLCNKEELEIGDIIQLGDLQNHFYHSLIVTAITNNDILIATHSIDSYMRSLSTYIYDNIRYIHIRS